jgi:serine/threonine protein kinase
MTEDWINGHSKECKAISEPELSEDELSSQFFTQGKYLTNEEAKAIVSKSLSTLTNYEKCLVPGKDTNLLGKGAFGQVCLLKNKINNQLYAVKVIEKASFHSKSVIRALTSEIEIHKRLKHENIIEMHEYIDNGKTLYIIMEYAMNGNLFHLIRRKGKFGEKEAFQYFKQVCNAIHFLHKHKLMHRDLKPENILVVEDGSLKLCDFGTCTESEKERSTFCGTTEYLAPEIVDESGYNEKVDIWSLGVLLYEMFHGKSPYQSRRDSEVFGKILLNKLEFASTLKEDAKDCIRSMLTKDASKRPSISKLIAHPWIQRMEKQVSGRASNKKLSECEECKCEQIHNLLEEGQTIFEAKTRESSKVRVEKVNCETLNEVPKHVLYGFPQYVPKTSKLAKAVTVKHSQKQRNENPNKSFWASVLSFGATEDL